jgi:uncharacterized protein (TIGR03503 family)
MVRANKISLLFIFLTLVMSNRQVFAAVEPTNDVRILIDVSGSMKKNDPKNLRTPALEMIVGLLPDQSKAGVWTFAKYVNMLVPHREVTKTWRNDAGKQTGKIHSNGLFTDIEQVLNKATVNQSKPDKASRRSVILLSDGLVDISTDPKASETSKKRILNEVVPRLKQANIVVHTIALSSGSDQALLREIALETDGWYEQVDDAEQLQRVFLHLFEKAAKRDTVPLKENTFKIDDSVTEMTVLVFRQADSKPTELIQPDQNKLSSISENDTVRWHTSESGYDLITIVEPQVGDWVIDAVLDPDNRVMVLTDLKLKTTDLPNNILIGETFDFDVGLTNKSEIITRDSFLSLVNAKLTHENEMTDMVEEDLNSSLRKGNYRTQVGETFQPGRNDVVTTIASATFERQRRQSINVVEMPFAVSSEQLTDEETRTHRITLKPDTSLVDAEKISIAAMLTAQDGSEWSYDVLKSTEENWQLTLAELEPTQEYRINLQIKAETIKGRTLFLQPNEIVLVDEMTSEVTEIPAMPDLSEEVSEELALLEEATEAEENQSSEMTAEQGLIEDLDELAPLDEIGELEELSPLEQIEQLDEFSSDIDTLLPSDDDELGGLGTGLSEEEGEQVGEVSSSILMIGNGILVLLIGIAFFIWRRKSGASKIPGEQL